MTDDDFNGAWWALVATIVIIIVAIILGILVYTDTLQVPRANSPNSLSGISQNHSRPALTSRYLGERPALAAAWSVTKPPKPKPVRISNHGVNWDAIAKCESGGHWNHHSATAGLYWGGLQMDLTFWHSYHGDRYAPRPDLASRAQQIAVAERAYRVRGLRPWPTCGRLG